MTRRNSRRSAQEALFAPSTTTTPPDEEKAAERTETPEKTVEQNPGDEICVDPKLSDDEAKELERAFESSGLSTIRPLPPEDYISEKYDIAPNCTNVPRLLYAILCEVVRRRA
jgi:hypothetical protein